MPSYPDTIRALRRQAISDTIGSDGCFEILDADANVLARIGLATPA